MQALLTTRLRGAAAARLRGGGEAAAAVAIAAAAPRRLVAAQQPQQRRYADAGGGYATAEGATGVHGEAAPEFAPTQRVFVNWSVYKGKGAMTVKLIRPSWVPTPNNQDGFVLDKAGRLLLEFAPASGTRTYDWASKITLALSATELGAIFAAPDALHEFFHDPNMGRDGKGSVTKSLKWAPAPDGKTYFISAALGGSAGGRGSVSVALDKGEAYVMEKIVGYAIPYMLGIDAAFNSA